VFTVNPITNNYVRIPCRLQYNFYRASFLIVINIHRGIQATNTGDRNDRYCDCDRHQVLEPLELQILELYRRQIPELHATDTGSAETADTGDIGAGVIDRLSHWNDSYWSHWNDSYWSHWIDSPWSYWDNSLTATGVIEPQPP